MALLSATVRNAAIISTLVVLPFLVLQVIHLPADGIFPLSLFFLLWLLPFFVLLLLLPLRLWWKEQKPLFWVRLIAAALLYAFWLGVLVDQLPCFLGEPDCD